MDIQLIIIGDEILIGKIKDLNTQNLAKSLRKTSFNLNKVHIISDNDDEIMSALTTVHSQGDIAIISGGLGPTIDDITKKTVAKYLNVEIKECLYALETTLKQYKRGNREYNKDKAHYHLLPVGTSPLHNPTGFAPGIYNSKEKILFCLPGVPHEFLSMLEENVLPIINQLKNEKFTRYKVCKTHSIAESKLFNSIIPNLWDELSKFAKVSSLPYMGGVDIALTITANSESQLDEKELKLKNYLLKSELNSNILYFGDDISLEQIIINEAINKGLKIGTAESCTGGLVASRLTDISGSSQCFLGSIISYANEVKVNQLSVSPKTLEKFGAVSEQTAKEMASGLREKLKLDIAVSTTGIAGPGGGSELKPVGTVGIGISSKNGTTSKIYNLNGNREILKVRFSQLALVSLLLEIRAC
jgi:nicotinamide-nucleotide amidase